MDTNVNYTVVGAFVVLLCTAIVLSIIWLSSGFSLDRYGLYAVYMTESVSGLNIDSPVEFNGVDVGTIKKIGIDPNNPKMVELILNIKDSTPITHGTVATLNTRGVTGITFLALKDKGEDLRPLVAKRGQPYPVIQTAPSLFVRLDTALTNLSMNFQKMSEAISSILDQDNQRAIKQTLQNLQRVSQSLAANSSKLTTIIENTSKASNQFIPLAQSGATTLKMLETQTLPAAYRLLNNLDNVTRTLSEVSEDIKQNPAVLIRGVEHRPLGPGESK